MVLRKGDAVEETVLVCEDSIEGILTGIYQVYAWKLPRESVRLQAGPAQPCLFVRYREVEPEPKLAEKVMNTVRRRFGEAAWEEISYALMAENDGKAQAVYRTVEAGLSGRIRGPLMQALGDPDVHQVFLLSRRVHNVCNRMLQFLRFRELEGGVLYASVTPDADVLALIMPHFADRLPLENFVIADARRGLAGVHPARQGWFLAGLGHKERESFSALEGRLSGTEREMSALFRSFCDSLGIRERRNLKLQQQLVPLKYREGMVEFKKE
ncbi:MAG: TIGR03915 family putative DNA repair protein [Eubacteriales bacterium]|nr:TIGR03915 family putative DNA repair protein [Eubacteriales bacterium]